MALDDEKYMAMAIEQAVKSKNEGGIPIGAVLVAGDGTVLGKGHNRRIQIGSAVHHGEIDALQNAGRLAGKVYKDATMYTTLSPCDMCTGACLMFGVSRVVMGENDTFVGGESYLKTRGVELVNLKNAECKTLMDEFITAHPEEWNEDIGV